MARFRFDERLCIGCGSCVVACKQWHGTPAGQPARREVTVSESGEFPHVTRVFTSRPVRGCDLCRSLDGKPRCARTCPTGALRFE